ncbi:hypothetical protein DFP72DRAFT_1151776 [Ephemerocybe angulata]|uniref:UBX domain-containing protein 1 n=1 Tax=Ephemerocybe angulata TaxID=980116 RepID=A0A8H6ICN5_9AGAR|nr:hypothetical protein DFP72DRAFT_1151776 [Tulosesus angulatus]
MAGDKDTLVGMGFDLARVEWALKATGNRGLQPAMDHILEHEGESVPDLSGVSESKGRSQPMDVDDDDDDVEALKGLVKGAVAGGSEGADVEAKSIKCSQCGKVFKNTALANYHAEKSGHDQFEESIEEVKPLTEEEKKQKLEDLRAKMAEKRARKAEEDALENKANENIRRKTHKDLNKLREEVQAKEILKEVEAKKREKVEEAKARAAVKAQIEADKKARADKAAREKAIREGKPFPDAGQSSPTPAAAACGSQTRAIWTDESPLREVAEFVASQSPDIDVDSVSFSQAFPRKTFSAAELSKSLKDLGLTPSAVLLASW